MTSQIGNGFALRRYAGYMDSDWKPHSAYRSLEIERAYNPDTGRPRALYRAEDGDVLYVGESLKAIRAVIRDAAGGQ